jgi:hypothetical protein
LLPAIPASIKALASTRASSLGVTLTTLRAAPGCPPLGITAAACGLLAAPLLAPGDLMAAARARAKAEASTLLLDPPVPVAAAVPAA